VIEIVGYSARLAPDFARLNYEWIERYFRIEEHDREMLDSPHEYIIEPGGEIFFALADETVAGTVALIRLDASTFELAKMAVSPSFQGRGIGDLLMQACIRHSGAAGAKRIVLESHTSLAPAITLYRKYGFVEIPLDAGTQYERVDIRMELAIGKPEM
jgi:ribosomal protein S18 acetylase RimI-like enzyme